MKKLYKKNKNVNPEYKALVDQIEEEEKAHYQLIQ